MVAAISTVNTDYSDLIMGGAPVKPEIDHVAKALVRIRESEPMLVNRNVYLPKRRAIIDVLFDIRSVLFPDHYPADDAPVPVDEHLSRIRRCLSREIASALHTADSTHDAQVLADEFISRLPKIQELLLLDAHACFDGDPAAKDLHEIIFCYPGFGATLVYRVAHELYLLKVPLIPRIMTEYAHGKTGIDIHPGATIGKHFMIDHGTGVVIGETCVIGDNVRIYQGVTLGALSTRGGQRLAGMRRHPTIEDNVTIYANASIFGGDTVIGANSVIGGSTFITYSVPPNSTVINQAALTQK